LEVQVLFPQLQVRKFNMQEVVVQALILLMPWQDLAVGVAAETVQTLQLLAVNLV
jgi:hypothetical protein